MIDEEPDEEDWGSFPISISRRYYSQLLRDSRLLTALEVAGVRTWDGYDNALTLLEEMEKSDGDSQD